MEKSNRLASVNSCFSASKIKAALALVFILLGSAAFTKKPKIVPSQTQTLRQQLGKVDRALQSCIEKTTSGEPTSMEANRAVALREKIFFATNSEQSVDAEANMKSVLREVREAEGLGRICTQSLAQLKLTSGKKNLR